MKKLILLAAAVMFTACGDTEKIDGLLSSKAETNNAGSTSSISSEADSTASSQESLSSSAEESIPDTSDGVVDIDLTKLSSTMVYSQVYDMIILNTDKYIGKKVRVKGPFAHSYSEQLDTHYFAVLISDATACCSQGLEFELTGTHTYPNDYPELGKEIIVEGEFTTYMEEGTMYCRLDKATLNIA